jgi:hypothetical protein
MRVEYILGITVVVLIYLTWAAAVGKIGSQAT